MFSKQLIFLVIFLVISFKSFLATANRNSGRGGVPNNNEENADQKGRDGKLFSLFNIVTFKNDACVTNSGTTGTTGRNRNGTCLTTNECSGKGGQASGSCASGFGVCCLFTVSSTGSTINQNCTYLQNPGFPSTYTSTTSLTYTVAKCSDDVCSIRLDFETHTILGPGTTNEVDSTHKCQDSFTVTGSTGLSSPAICGTNAGQHVYMDIGTASTATATLAFAFSTTTSTTRQWEVKVTQIKCFGRERPTDPGCLQYHTGTTGRIETFNFQANSQHLISQNYATCIRQEEGYCCVRYSLCADTNSWDIDNSQTAASGIGSECTYDYVGIQGVSATCDETATSSDYKICGAIFAAADSATINAPFVCDCDAPFQVNFYTDTSNDGTTSAQRGACLQYQQIACSS